MMMMEPSCTTGRVSSGDLSEDENPDLSLPVDHSPALIEPAFDAACSLTREILLQLTQRDSPPWNDNGHIYASLHFNDLLNSHSRQSSPTRVLGASSFGSDGSDMNAFFHDFANHSNLIHDATETNTLSSGVDLSTVSHSYNRVGHKSMVHLCQLTLERMQIGSSLEELRVPTVSSVAQSKLEFVAPPQSSLTNKRVPFWKKRKHVFGEEKKEDSSSYTETPMYTQPRLHMFASEYARHLSTSQLAPAPCRSKAAKMKFKLPKHGKSQKLPQTMALEDADPATLTGAIIDICVMNKHVVTTTTIPQGYHRITQTASGQVFPLDYFLYVKKEPNWDRAAQRPTVTAVTLIFPDQQEFVPPGFCVAKTQQGVPANIGTSDKRCYLVFRRSREGNPLTGLLPLIPPENVPAGYTVVERTPRNHAASVVVTGSSMPMFFAYRQRLANLEVLRPMPLLRTVQPKAGADFTDDAEDEYSYIGGSKQLRAYYSTGATTVTANIGKFHIMDRSTHALLSPSSITNRLHLIEASRRHSMSESGVTASECGTLSVVLAGGGSHLQSSSSQDFESETSSRSCKHEDGLTISDDTDLDAIQQLSSLLSRAGSIFTEPMSPQSQLFVQDPELHQCVEALRFIPLVEAASPNAHSQVRLQGRIAVLTPILTVCYTRHGGAALVAVDGLTTLLTEANFFDDDFTVSCVDDLQNTKSSSRLTLLDLAIQTVCDVATSSAMETSFAACVEFVELAVRMSQGQLNTRTVGCIVRFYLFVFYFGASVPFKKIWQSQQSSRAHEHGEKDYPLLDDPRDPVTKRGYLPGGAPQAAVLAFKELISLSIVRLGRSTVSDLVLWSQTSLRHASSVDQANQDGKVGALNFVLGSLVDTVVINAVNHVERANYTQLAFQQIHRSGGSELFWHDMMNVCGLGLFGKDLELNDDTRDLYILIFAVLASLVKLASSKSRTATVGGLAPKEVTSKMLSLELILFFLELWNDKQEALKPLAHDGIDLSRQQSTNTLAYTIRRMVVPCLLSNTSFGLEDPQVFRRMVRILTEMWCSPIYRLHCQVEIGILVDHFAIRLLQAGPQFVAVEHLDLDSKHANVSLLKQQLDMIQEIKSWFSRDPKDVIEMYLNYDTDMCMQVQRPIQMMHGTQRKVFQKLCGGLSTIAEQCGEIIGEHIKENQSNIMSGSKHSASMSASGMKTTVSVDKSDVQEAARLLRRASLEALSQIVKSLAVSAATGTSFASLLLSWTSFESYKMHNDIMAPSTGDALDTKCGQSTVLDVDELLETDAASPQRKTSDGDGKSDDAVVNYWHKACALERNANFTSAALTARETVCVALEMAHCKSLKKAMEYLIACGTMSPSPRDIASFLHLHKDLLDAHSLGHYLSEGGTGSNEIEYWNSVRYLFVRSSSFAGMNVEEGLRHFLTHSGFHLPGESQMIDRMMSTFAQVYFEDNAGDSKCCPFDNEDVVYVLSFAIIMLNTDLHRASLVGNARKSGKKMTKADFLNNLRGAASGADISKDYLSTVYDNIESNPIAVLSETCKMGDDSGSTIQEMLCNVRNADSLLRGLAIHNFKFSTIDDVVEELDNKSAEEALIDLTRSCVSKTWNEWYGVINTGLETAHLDPTGMEPCIEILHFALCITIILGMPTECAAFLNQFGRLKTFEERRYGRWVSPDHSYKDEDWYLNLESACSGADDRKMWALSKIREWMLSLESALHSDVANKVRMAKVVKEFIDGDFLMRDPSRSLIRSDNLSKKSSRTGRTTDARFYLFSDVLIYAKAEADGRHKICTELPLHLIKVLDFFPPTQKNRQRMIEIQHPHKSFFIVCPTNNERNEWAAAIKVASRLEMERKMKVEAARMAAQTTR